jgi:hypothetical protein
MYQSEDKFQSDCYLWFHESYPQYRELLCYNLNNSRNRIRASMDKAMGLQKGRSDMVFYFAGQSHHIELKVNGGSQSPDQKKWQKTIENAGFKYYVISDSLQDFQNLINGLITLQAV